MAAMEDLGAESILSQPALKTLRLDFARRGYAGFAFSVPSVAIETCFKFIKVELTRECLDGPHKRYPLPF